MRKPLQDSLKWSLMPAPEQILWFRARQCSFGGDESQDNHPQMPTTSNFITSRTNRSDGGEDMRVWLEAGTFIRGPQTGSTARGHVTPTRTHSLGFMWFLSTSKSKCTLMPDEHFNNRWVQYTPMGSDIISQRRHGRKTKGPYVATIVV